MRQTISKLDGRPTRHRMLDQVKRFSFAVGASIGLMASPLLVEESQAQTRNVMVHLFEWKWTDIENECAYLEEKGYGSVQVSPPNEHAVIADAGYPWWQRYQPVSYELTNSRSGTIAQFESMVETCWKDHGVKIIVDAVVNHMAAGSGVGSNGNTFSGASSYFLYNKDGVEYRFGGNDFHSQCSINYGQQFVSGGEIRNCWVAGGGLPDLKTEDNAWVRARITDYLNSMVEMGVAGFRIDAAKHMNPDDITTITSNLQNLRSDNGWFSNNERPYVFQEVIYGGNQGSAPEDYDNTVNGAKLGITEFRYGQKIGEKFRYDASGGISDYIKYNFPVASAGWGMIDSSYALIFTDNHDNQRGHGSGYFTSFDDNSIGGIVTHFYDGGIYNLANVFMLAWPYGTPKIMSSYDWNRNVGQDGGGFKDFNDGVGPPSDRNGNTNNVSCFNGWICEHRWSAIAGMVGFNNYAQDAWNIGQTWHNNGNQIAFARVTPSNESRAFVVINREGYGLGETLQTGLPEGEYCNVAEADYNFVSEVCTGPTINVNSSGFATFNLNAMSAAAIHVGAIISSGNSGGGDGDGNSGSGNGGTGNSSNVDVTFSCSNGNTNPGDSIYVVGDQAELGNWTASVSQKLEPTSYPTWTATLSVPANTTIKWKCVKANESSLVINQWQGGADNTVTTSNSNTASSASL